MLISIELEKQEQKIIQTVLVYSQACIIPNCKSAEQFTWSSRLFGPCPGSIVLGKGLDQ